MSTESEQFEGRSGPLLARGGIGGILMGLANLVPGISGGTMLLVAGVYPQFIGAVAELTTLKFRPRSLSLIAVVAVAAGLTILMLAGVVKDLVVVHRWIMYSLFIGLTLGGAPLLWRMLRPANPHVWIGVVIGLGVMIVMALIRPGEADLEGTNYLLLLIAGVAGASAMILPGVSGAYLLLVLGQYVVILAAVHDVKLGLLGENGAGRDLARVLEAMHVVIPVGLGVLAGIVGVSNLLKMMLARMEKLTLGLLLGLLLGAVIGLWPFQRPVEPVEGEWVRGEIVTAENLTDIDPEHWRTERFTPTPGQIAGSLGLILLGFAVTQVIAHIGRDSTSRPSGR